jgi:hypothetical protein
MALWHSIPNQVAAWIGLLVFGAGISAAHAEPWAVKRTEFAQVALGQTKVAPGSTTWNILALGLFCGTRGLNPGRINLYAYGIGADRLATGIPIRAIIAIDGQDLDLTLRPVEDIAVGPIDADVAQRIMRARSLSVTLTGYGTSRPDVVDMTGAAAAIGRGLKNCLR